MASEDPEDWLEASASIRRIIARRRAIALYEERYDVRTPKQVTVYPNPKYL
jgi:hypothetical protein